MDNQHLLGMFKGSKVKHKYQPFINLNTYWQGNKCYVPIELFSLGMESTSRHWLSS